MKFSSALSLVVSAITLTSTAALAASTDAQTTLDCRGNAFDLVQVTATLGANSTLTSVDGWFYYNGKAVEGLKAPAVSGAAVDPSTAALSTRFAGEGDAQGESAVTTPAVMFDFQDLGFRYGGYHLVVPKDFATTKVTPPEASAGFDATLVSEGTDEVTTFITVRCSVGQN